MGLIILTVPLIIYYSIVVPLVNRSIIEEIENQRKKAIFFWLLVLFPIADHIVGYVVYKALCFSVGGVHIYKTVTDVEEQRAYWFYEGLKSTKYHGNDEEYKFLTNNGLVRRDGRCLNPIKQEGKDNYSCKREDIERVYLNYCNDTYNTLPKEHENYKKSCTNANELIAQYRLENVIKVPKSSYRLNVKDYDFSIPFLNIEVSKDHGENTATKDKLYSSVNFVFRGGWYIKYIGRYVLDMPFWIACNKGVVNREYREQYEKVGVPEIVIPNPYKQSN